MVLDLPGGLFGQDDVRETPVSTVGTTYLSIPSIAFRPDDEVRNYSTVETQGEILLNDATGQFLAQVFLPQGAVVKAVVVYGNAGSTDTTWSLVRHTYSTTTTSTMATANHDTEDTSISNATIDNSAYNYFIVSNLEINDRIQGARITYTT